MAKNHDFEELPLHCPFCGACDALAMEDADRYWIMCLECSACGPCEDSKEEAVLSWCERYDLEQARTIYKRASRRTVEFLG